MDLIEAPRMRRRRSTDIPHTAYLQARGALGE
jgi:hypothetical protein